MIYSFCSTIAIFNSCLSPFLVEVRGFFYSYSLFACFRINTKQTHTSHLTILFYLIGLNLGYIFIVTQTTRNRENDNKNWRHNKLKMSNAKWWKVVILLFFFIFRCTFHISSAKLAFYVNWKITSRKRSVSVCMSKILKTKKHQNTYRRVGMKTFKSPLSFTRNETRKCLNEKARKGVKNPMDD